MADLDLEPVPLPVSFYCREFLWPWRSDVNYSVGEPFVWHFTLDAASQVMSQT